MEMRYMGDTGVKVSNLCFGCMTFGPNQWGVGNLGQKAATGMISACLDAGINFFDTADVYAFGASETLLGEALAGRREKVIVATKVRGRMSNDPNDVGLTRRHILASVDASLKRLKTDYIDLYQVHSFDPKTPLEQTLSTLNDLVHSGKVRYIGASNFAAWQLTKALWISDRHGWARFETLQPYYSLVGRELENELVPLCQDQRIGILPWSPLAGGWLSGKYRRGEAKPPDARLSGSLGGFIPVDEEVGYRTLDVLQAVASTHGVSVAAIALGWVAAQPGITSVIIGAKTMPQLADNLKAAEIQLGADELIRLDQASNTPRPYPHWMFASTYQDR